MTRNLFVATLRRAAAGQFPIDEEVVRFPAVAGRSCYFIERPVDPLVLVLAAGSAPARAAASASSARKRPSCDSEAR